MRRWLVQTGTRRVRRFSTLSRCLWLWRCHHHVKCVNHPDERGLSVSIPHICDHVGRYCSKIGPKRKWELSRENMHQACRDEHSKRIREGRCVVCNEESIWGSFVRWRRRSVRYRLSRNGLKLTLKSHIIFLF